MRVQLRDLEVLAVAMNNGGYFRQRDIDWGASYQAKMRGLRRLCRDGLLEAQILDRRKPNLYSITDKGRELLHKRQKSLSWNKGVSHETK